MYRPCQDVLVARKVARACNQRHDVIEVGRDFLDGFATYAARSAYLSEGGLDVSRSPDLYVSERARAIAPVKVVGTYGSEIMRHAVMLSPRMPVPDLYRAELGAYIDEVSQRYVELDREHPVTFAAFRQSPWYHAAVLGLEQTQLTVRSPYLDNEFVRTVYRAPRRDGLEKDLRLDLIRDGNPILAAIRTDRGLGGRADAVGAITRAWLEFSFRAEYMFDFGMPQWLARADRWLAPLHLERLFVGRHKFSSFRIWYRDELSGYVRDMLLDPRSLARPYLAASAVRTIVESHLARTANHTIDIHKLLTLELLQRTLVECRP
jgi:asparagine synthase (glutamine-hydrolysing)